MASTILPAIRGSRLLGILDGSVAAPPVILRVEKADKMVEESKNPAHAALLAQDQHLLSYLLSTMTKELLVHVSSHEHAAQLSQEKKGDLSASTYYSKMKGIADEMAASGKKIDDDDLIGHIRNGLESEYNSFVRARFANCVSAMDIQFMTAGTILI
uniref:Uncharacterized protein n=1 Tax=Setaria viridis TaxID=4556 RepID=A0A4U6WDP4_SETVI|nr:hypothetical protein SEVIR_1G231700v2 [Setaria viridis]